MHMVLEEASLRLAAVAAEQSSSSVKERHSTRRDDHTEEGYFSQAEKEHFPDFDDDLESSWDQIHMRYFREDSRSGEW